MNLFKFWAVLVFGAMQLVPGKTATGTISGTVKFAGGEPAVGVRVMALVVASVGRGGRGTSILASSVRTDKDGHYRLEDIPPGRYYIAAGLVDSPTFYPGTALQNEARVMTINQDGPPLSEINFSIGSNATNAPPLTGAYQKNISGLLLTEDGQPLPPVPLKVVETGSNMRAAVNDGFFSFFLSAGTNAQIAVEGLPPGYSLGSVIYGGTNVGQKFLVDGKESLLLMIRVQQAATLPTVTARGKVENIAHELNTTNLRVMLTPTLSGGATVTAPIRPDYSFELSSVPLGTYRTGIQAGENVWSSSSVAVIRGAGADLKVDLGNNPFPDLYEFSLSRPSPFTGGKEMTITGVATQRPRLNSAPAYFRMDVKADATGGVKPWAIYMENEALFPNIAVGETYTVTGTAAADGSNRLKAKPF